MSELIRFGEIALTCSVKRLEGDGNVWKVGMF